MEVRSETEQRVEYGHTRKSRVCMGMYRILPHGVWRSLVARLGLAQEVVGSNPATPTEAEDEPLVH